MHVVGLSAALADAHDERTFKFEVWAPDSRWWAAREHTGKETLVQRVVRSERTPETGTFFLRLLGLSDRVTVFLSFSGWEVYDPNSKPPRTLHARVKTAQGRGLVCCYNGASR